MRGSGSGGSMGAHDLSGSKQEARKSLKQRLTSNLSTKAKSFFSSESRRNNRSIH